MQKEKEEYCKNKYLDSYGVKNMVDKMVKRYDQKYLDYRKKWSAAEELNELDFPVNLELDLIDACTLSCPQCLRSPDLLPEWKEYIGKGSRLSYEQIDKLLDECSEYALPSVNIGGSGECMLHPDFSRICGTIMDHDILELRIISNGTRLSPEISENLIDQQIHFLSISIDAASAETYGKVRGKQEMYQKVIDNVNSFLEIREKQKSEFPMLRVTFVRQEKNDHEVESFIDYWSSRADLVDIQTYSDFRETEYRDDFSCNQPWKRLAVYADSHVTPCCGFPGIVFDLGSIEENSLQSMWVGEKMQAIRKMLINKKYSKACRQCMGALVTLGK